MRKRIREALYIGLFDSLPLLRDPAILLLLSMFSLLPVLFTFVFTGGGSMTQQALVGAIVLSLAFTGLFSAQSVYFNKHWFRFQDMLVASPVSPASYAFGLSVSTFIVSVPSLVIALLLLVAARPVQLLDVGLAMVVSLALWISMLFTGFAIGASTKNVRRANSLPQVLSFFLGFIPPVYYPLSQLPPEIQPFALLAPTTHAAQLAKHYFGLVSLGVNDIVIGWTYMLAFSALMAYVALKRAHWVDP